MKSKRVLAYLEDLPVQYQGYLFNHIITTAVEIAESDARQEIDAMRERERELIADADRWRQAYMEANERIAMADKIIAEKNRK